MPPLLYQPFFAHPDRPLYTMPPPTYHPECEYSCDPTCSHCEADKSSAVTVTLRSTRPSSTQTRNIILRPEVPVNVGRSSRSEAKNLSATAYNALFDCPVISRRHAELELKVNNWTEEKHQVYIKDTGSMHGTSVNGQKLQSLKPFQLQVGDIVRLGESVNRADSECLEVEALSFFPNPAADNYDGVTVTLDCISTATKKNTAQVKSSQQGISVPSESESEIDDEDDDGDSDAGANLHPSSAQTSPDQLDGSSDPQPSHKMGSSMSNVIMLEDEDDEPVSLYNRRVTNNSVAIPDTFAEEIPAVADSLAAATRGPVASLFSLQFGAGQGSNQEVGGAGAALNAAREGPMSADEDFDHEHANSEDSWSEQDHISEDEQDSDEHSDSHEDFDRQSFLSEEFNMADADDDVAVEDDEDDEGPEIMSSKRRPSNELGTLGDEPYRIKSESNRETAIPARPHYDPVRGFQVSAPITDKALPAHRSYESSSVRFPNSLADLDYSTKWDVGPGPVADDFHTQPFSYSFGLNSAPLLLNSMTCGTQMPSDIPQYFSPTAMYGETSSRDIFALDAASVVPSNSPTGAFQEYAVPYSKAAETNTKKRKAPENSTADEPTTTAQAPATSEETVSAAAPVAAAVAPTEPHSKKRKIKQAHAQKSLLRTAAIEAGKYTAGAIIGGIGLVTILASPIGEALASC